VPQVATNSQELNYVVLGVVVQMDEATWLNGAQVAQIGILLSCLTCIL
jgi:hypothetical protein